MASLGHRLFQTRKYAEPDPIPALKFEELGEQARCETEDDERPPEQVAAGDSNAPTAPSAVSIAKPVISKAVSFAEPPPDDPFRYGASKAPPQGIAAEAGIVEEPGANPALAVGPSSPRGSASLGRDAVDLETSSRPSKQAKVETSDQVIVVSDQHEDEELEFSFQDDEVDMLEIYDNSIGDDYDLHSDTCDNSELDKLVFAFTPHEPNLSEHELKVLDDIADRVQIQRLHDMEVFIPFGENSSPDVAPKNLSARFVRTWRESTHLARKKNLQSRAASS